MSKLDKLTIDIDLAIEEQAKEIIRSVIGKHLYAADQELQERFDELSDQLKVNLSKAAKQELRSLLKK